MLFVVVVVLDVVLYLVSLFDVVVVVFVVVVDSSGIVNGRESASFLSICENWEGEWCAWVGE